MPCPYAERKGALVYCRLAKKKVNPLAYPCLGNKYKKCKIYKKYAGKEEVSTPPPPPEAEQVPQTPQTAPPPRVEAEAKPSEAPPIPEPVPTTKLEIPKIEVEIPKIEVSQPTKESSGTVRTRGLTLDGKPARNCLECIYYGKNTRICLLLGVEVKNPLDPPCAK